MAHDDGEIYWYDPDPRAILPLNTFHTPKSLSRLIKKRPFEIRVNSAFNQVIQACADRGSTTEKTWINHEIMHAYCEMHRLGFAHSVETWQDGRLVGGLYGVAIRGLFAGESMFSTVSNSSKVALVYLVNRLRERGYKLLDIQFMTAHLQRFGAIEISAQRYKQELLTALQIEASFDEGDDRK